MILNRDQFHSYVIKACERGCWAHVGAIVRPTLGGTATNLATSVVLSADNVMAPPVGPNVVNLPGELRAARGTVEPKRVPQLIQQMWDGMISSAVLPVEWDFFIDTRRKHGGVPQFSVADFLADAQYRPYPFVPYTSVTAYSHGDMLSELFGIGWCDRTNFSLTASTSKWRSISKLAQSLSIANGFTCDTSASLIVAVPLWASIETIQSDTMKNELRVTVRLGWSSVPENACIVIVPEVGDTASHPLSESNWTIEKIDSPGRRLLVHGVIPYEATEVRTEILLVIDGFEADRKLIRQPNLRIKLLKLFDPDLSLIAMGATEFTKNSGVFEIEVAKLLTACGFASIHVGGGDRLGSPDVLAFAGENTVLVIECTVEFPVPDKKINSLLSRAHDCETACSNTSARPMRIVPLLFIRKELTDDDRKQILDRGVRGIALRQMQELFRRAEAGDTLTDLVRSLCS